MNQDVITTKRLTLIAVFLSIFAIGSILMFTTPASVKATYGLTAQTDDCVSISFNVFEPNNGKKEKPAVIIGHGLMANKEMLKEYAIEIAAAGFVAITFDFRGLGQSSGDLNVNLLINDVKAIKRYLENRADIDIDKLGYIGYSMGGYPGNKIVKDDDDFNFAKNFSAAPIPEKFPPTCRDGRSLQLLTENKGKITPTLMMEFLREHKVGLCMHRGTPSAGSQVSLLRSNSRKSIHWFTGTMLPCLSVFKPYIFPVAGLKVLEPKPNDKIDSEWLWSKHSDFIKPFKNRFNKVEYQEFVKKSKEIENPIIKKVNDILADEENISEEEFVNRIRKINSEAWKKSEEMIN